MKVVGLWQLERDNVGEMIIEEITGRRSMIY